MQIFEERAGGTCIMRLAGELDEHTAADFRLRADGAIDSGCRHLILVLKDLRFVDSSGLGVLMGRYRRIVEHGGQVSLVAPPPHIRALLEMAGIPRLMPLYRSQRQALMGGVRQGGGR